MCAQINGGLHPSDQLIINREQLNLSQQKLASTIDTKIGTVVGDLQLQLETKQGDYQRLMEDVKTLENRVEELKSTQSHELTIVTGNLEKFRLLSKQSEAKVEAVEERMEKQQDIRVKHKLSAKTLNNPRNINSIADSLYHGRGVAKDREQAFKFYLVAAEKGYAPAMLNVSRIYFDKENTTKDLEEGKKWCLKAAQAGFPEATIYLASIFGRRIDRREVIECGIRIGPFDRISHDNVPFWYWMIKAAQLGQTEAIKMLEKETEEITGRNLYTFGQLFYINGWGLDLKQPDYSVAFECYQRASKKNSNFAPFTKLRQAHMYLQGLGVKQDRLMAKNLCEQILGFSIRDDFEIHIGNTANNLTYPEDYIELPGTYTLSVCTLRVRVIIKGDFTVHGNLIQEEFGRYEVRGKQKIMGTLSVVGACQVEGKIYDYENRAEAEGKYPKLKILPWPPIN